MITTGDTPPQVVPLVAGEDVGQAGFFGRIWLGLKRCSGWRERHADASSASKAGKGSASRPR